MPENLIQEEVESLVGRVADEFLKRQERGERPDVEQFTARYPQAAPILRKVLSALAFLEQSLGDVSGSAIGSGEAIAGTLGDFRIMREIGRGGMGIVYEAEQISLGRRVALKVLPFAAALDAKHLQRFKNEAQAAAHLQHTNIVPVHYVGCERGVHFYAMQYIEGQTLAAVIHDLRQQGGLEAVNNEVSAGAANSLADELICGRWAPGKQSSADSQRTGPYSPSPAGNAGPNTGYSASAADTSPKAALSTEQGATSPGFFRTVANLGIQAAEGLEHAHQLGIIHRDIKPANLLIEWRAGGVNPPNLWVTDFGLAHCQSQPGLTMTGDLVGTLRYMSPEQALAKRVAVDARTDIYSLGVTLYELLTLEPAYNGKNREEVLRQIAFEEPRPPRRLNKTIPAELETVVLKAMAKNPEERYATSQELADDLGRYLEDKPIKARRPSLRQRAVKWSRRHKTVVRAAVLVTLLLATGLVAGTLLVSNEQTRTAEARAQAATDLATAETEARNRLETQFYYQNIALAEREWSANNLSRMQKLLDDCPQDLRGWEWNYLKGLRHKSLPAFSHSGAALCAVFSPDSRRIASSSQDGIVKVWDAQTGEDLLSFQAHADHVRSVAFSPEGQRLATASWDGTAKVWDAQTGQLIHTLKIRGGLGSAQKVAFSPDGRRLACGGGQRETFGEVTIWDATTGEQLLILGGHTLPVVGVAFSPDGRQLASASDGTVKVWDVDWAAGTGREKLSFRAHRLRGVSVAFSPDGRRLASASGDWITLADGEVKVWDVRTGAELLVLGGHITSVWSVAFSPDGRRLATAGMDQTVKLWDVATGQEVLTLRGHLNRVRSVVFSPDGTRLVTASDDRTVRVWDGRPQEEESREEVRTLRGHRSGVRSVALHPSGGYLASAGDDALVKIWDTQSGKELRTLPGRTGITVQVEFSHQGERLTLWGRGGLSVWDTNTWQERLPTMADELAFCPVERYLARSGDDLDVKDLDAATGQKLRGLLENHWVRLGKAWHPAGRWLALPDYDGSVLLWDATTGAPIQAPQLRHGGPATSVAFSPGGGRLASGGLDRTVKIWDTATWQDLRTIRDPTGAVMSMAWSPDGRRLVWGSQDATIKVGNPATGEILDTLRGHTSWVVSVVFSRDGRWIVSGSLDGTVKIWNVPPLPKASP